MIGILGFQGCFIEHKKMLDKLNLNSIIVKNVIKQNTECGQ